MKVCTPKYFNEFACSNSECTDTCCKYWQVEIDNKTYSNYKKAILNSEELGLTVKKHLSKGKAKHFYNCKDGNCPFLNENQLCSLHINYGYEILPHTCKAFPRFYNSFGMYEEIGLSFSCPTAAKLICEGDGTLVEFDDDRKLETYTDVDADLFFAIKTARNKIYNFLSITECTSGVVIASLSEYSKKIQQLIDKRRYHEIYSVNIEIKDEEFSFEDFKVKYIKKHLGFKMLRKDWKKILLNALNNDFRLSDRECIIWLKYFVYRYFIESSKDGKFLQKFSGAVTSLTVIGCLGFDFCEAAQKYSKEIEHNEGNIKKIF